MTHAAAREGDPRGAVVRARTGGRTVLAAEHGTDPPHAREWSVHVSIFETADDTSARAVLLADAPEHLVATGRSRRSAQDRAVAEIGAEVAVARALRHLSESLLATAERDVEDRTGTDAQVRPT